MEQLPFDKALGVRVVRRHKDGVTCRLDLHPGLLNSDGVVHGGVLASVADEAAWWAVTGALGDRAKLTTSELKVNYLRPVAGRFLTARCHVLKLGRMLNVTRVEIFDERRKLAAHAGVTYVVIG